jgi:hypothetical protein
MIEAMCKENNCEYNKSLDDQRMMTQLCKLYPKRFDIDTNKDIFLTLCYKNGMQNASIDVNSAMRQLVYKKKFRPCILHGAGNAAIDDIIKALGYEITVVTYKQSMTYNICVISVVFFILTVLLIILMICK